MSATCVCFSAGKLGHGDTNRVYKPKLVEALQGMFIRKVCAGSQSSLALTSTGQVRLDSCRVCAQLCHLNVKADVEAHSHLLFVFRSMPGAVGLVWAVVLLRQQH